MEFIKKIKDFIKKENLIEVSDKVVIGFSGGPDSVFLLDNLLKLKKEYQLEFVLAHVNHQLRGEESDGDQDFVKQLANKLGIKAYFKSVDIKKYARENKVGEEEAGREIRYDFFEEVLIKEKAQKVALAHNKDDEIETFMFRLMRGTSLKGLEGIPVKRGFYIRPILNIYKCDIMEYLKGKEVEYRVDSSNLKSDYTRNSIRLDLIPSIEKRYNINFKDKIISLMEEIREANGILDLDYKEFLVGDYIDIPSLKTINKFQQRKVLNSYLNEKGVEVTRQKLNLVLNLISLGGSKEVDLGKNLKVKKEYEKLFVSLGSGNLTMKIKEKKLSIPGETSFGRYKIIASLDKTKNTGKNSVLLEIPEVESLRVRSRENGDRIVISMEGKSKKLKDILINEKIPKEIRDEIPIVILGNEVLWVAGIRASEAYKSKDPNSNTIKLTVEEGNFSERGQK